MFIRNRHRQHPMLDADFIGLRKEGRYWFPHSCKYFGWLLVLGVTTASSVILIYYGMSFGMIKSYLWLTGILTSFLLGFFIFTPIRIALIILIDSIFFKKRPLVDYRRVYSLFLFNPEDEQKLLDVKRNRRLNKKLYKPTPLWKLEDRLEDVKYNIEIRNLSADGLVYIIFMITVCYLVLFNKADTGYFSYEVIKNLVVHAYYTDSIAFTEIRTYDSFLAYLKETFLPALMINHTQSEKIKRNMMGPEDFENFGFSNNTTVFQRSWTMDPAIKLIGIPRLRQLRATTDTCFESKYLKSRNIKCAQELTMFNQETRNFSIKWALYPNKELTDLKISPWNYQTGFQTDTLPIFSKFSYYSSGGYILNLAKNFNDSEIIIDYMHAFQWIDIQTRVIFIEFTTYSVNTNIFVVVTLIVEKSATGFYIPSYQIEPCIFLFTNHNTEISYLVITVLFLLLVFCLLFREGIRMYRTSIKVYLKRAFAILNLAVIFCGLFSTLSIFLRSLYVSNLVEKLDKSSNNVFISFIYAASWYKWTSYVEALLVCLASFKLFRLLSYRVMFFRLYAALSHCYRHFGFLFDYVFILTFSFTSFFFLTLILYDFEFSNYFRAMSSIIGRSVALDDTFNFELFFVCPWFVTVVYFLFFVSVITIMLINLFIAVVCFFYQIVREKPLINKYSIRKYIKYIVTRNKQSDIYHLKNHFDDESDAMFLKKKFNSKKKKLIVKSTDSTKLYSGPTTNYFVKEKIINFSKFYLFTILTETAIKNTFLALFYENEEEKKKFREKALSSLFLNVILISKCDLIGKNSEKFLIARELEAGALSKAKLEIMKKLIENLVTSRHWTLKKSPTDSLRLSFNLASKIKKLNTDLKRLIDKKKIAMTLKYGE